MCILWDIATGQQITALKDHLGEVDCLSILPDKNTFLSGKSPVLTSRYDSTICVSWNSFKLDYYEVQS